MLINSYNRRCEYGIDVKLILSYIDWTWNHWLLAVDVPYGNHENIQITRKNVRDH